MKPRHAAALALVGWYLMELPPPPEGRGIPGFTDDCIASDDPQLTQHQDYPKTDGASLWQWNTIAVFNSEDDCLQAKPARFKFL
jgi:hypothetical protein